MIGMASAHSAKQKDPRLRRNQNRKRFYGLRNGHTDDATRPHTVSIKIKKESFIHILLCNCGRCGGRKKRKIMTKAERYLLRLKEFNDAINKALPRLAELRAAMYGNGSMDYSSDRVQTSPARRMEEAVARYVDYSRKVDRMTDRYIRLRLKYSKMITGLPDPDQQEVLYLLYIEFMTVTDTAHQMEISERQVYRVKAKALQAFEAQYLAAESGS